MTNLAKYMFSTAMTTTKSAEKAPPLGIGSGTVQEVDHAGHGKASDAALDASVHGQAINGFEHLTPWETIKAFKYNTFVCSILAFAAAADCYQVAYVFPLTTD
jgi:hypothetical protein